MSLEEYNKKRNFEKTIEPKGKQQKQKNNIYVIQYHEARAKHFDLRLEWKGVLLSWAVPKGPSFNPKTKRLAVQVEDHPISYSAFEGTIPKGEYGGGTVMVWDKGTWVPVEDFEAGLKKGILKFEIFGERIKGKWTLIRIKNEKNWLLIKEKDKFAKKTDGIEKYNTSIKTKKTINEIASPLPFKKVDVQLPKLVNSIPEGADWIFEVKYDGYRIVAFVENGNVKLLTRNGKDYSKNFEKISNSLKRFFKNRSVVLDGEIVVIDENGKTDFQKLQNSIRLKNEEVTFVVFDILAVESMDLRNNFLIERKKILQTMLKKAPKNIIYSNHVEGKGKQCYLACKKLGLEGIVAKQKNSKYVSGKSEQWVKIKNYLTEEFVVGGYVLSEKKKGIKSLLLGTFEDNKFKFFGKVGTGFGEKNSKEILEKLEKIKQEKSPFSNLKSNKNVVWVKPKYIAEIQFAEKTGSNLLRQASFKCLREDKTLNEHNFENILKNAENFDKNAKKTIKNIKITNPNKIIYEKENIKKIDVVNYYNLVSKRMMPFVENRILSVVRCNKGIGGSCFYKKHEQVKLEGVETVKILNSENIEQEYFYISNSNGLIAQAQMGTIEFHAWGSTVQKLNKPDIMVFDLDPDKNLSLEKVREGVLDLKKILTKLRIKSFLKTSGGKGYHIVVPFEPNSNWETFSLFAENVAKLMEEKWPEKYTTNIRKDKRKGKIFVDYLRNGKGATSVAPYSLRAREGACVSMPISWKELKTVAPNGINMFEALERIKKADPWKNFYKTKQKLKN